MDDQELAELLRYARARAREVGLGALDDSFDEARANAEFDPRSRVLSYLDTLRSDMALGSEESSRNVMRKFRDLTNSSIDGIVVRTRETDRDKYDRAEIELVGSRALTEVVDELTGLIAAVAEG